jgi:ribosomal protein L7Ae-like RNA K-turn-binding protein
MVTSGGVPDLVGLAMRAGAVASGVSSVRQAVRDRRAFAVLVARDASAVQLAKVDGLLAHRPVPRRTVGSMRALGGAVGKGALAAVAITDRGLAEAILAKVAEDVGAKKEKA